jgi:N-acetylglucosamine kinase-like BadF-type ATPase
MTKSWQRLQSISTADQLTSERPKNVVMESKRTPAIRCPSSVSPEIFTAADLGDKDAQAILDQSYDYLSVVGITKILNKKRRGFCPAFVKFCPHLSQRDTGN